MKKEKRKELSMRTISFVLIPLFALAMFFGLQSGVFAAESKMPCTADGCGGTYDNGICTADNTHYQAATQGADGFYQISNAGQLYWFAAQVNGGKTSINGKLMADITVNKGTFDANGNYTLGEGEAEGTTPRVWTPIGNNSNNYTGTFDGQNHTVSGLYFNDTNDTTGNYVGLFGYVGSNGKVSNVGVIDSYFKGYYYIGGVCGYNFNSSSTITNCYNSGTVSGTGNSIGGVCGYNFGTITNSYNSGTVSGSSYIGGVCGYNYGEISNSYNSGTVSGTGNYIGGVCGKKDGGTITNCYYDKDICKVGGISKADVPNQAEGKTTDDFASGEVAYLLSKGTNGSIWGQQLGTDAYPVFDSAKKKTVYQYTDCKGNKKYANSQLPNGTHSYVNGICSVCGGYQEAELVDGVYRIGNLGQLMWFGKQVTDEETESHTAMLTADITIDNTVIWKAITPKKNNGNTFDGNWHTITFANNKADSKFGLFASYNYSTIKNLYLAGNIECNNDAYDTAVLVNSAYRTAIKNVISTCNITNSGTGSTGGLTGYFGGRTGSIIENCAVYADVTGGGKTGGLIGAIWDETRFIERAINCAYVGTVSGSESAGVGAIVGYNGNKTNWKSTFGNVYYCAKNGENSYLDFCGISTKGGELVLTNVEAKSKEQFTSGEVAYLLSLGCKIREVNEDNISGNYVSYSGDIWGQKLGTDADAYPVFDSAKKKTVYYGYTSCDESKAATYTNDSKATSTRPEHKYDNGICSVCGGYQAAVQITAENANDYNVAADKYTGYYAITNAGQLYWFAAHVNSGNTTANAVLTKDITVNKGTDGKSFLESITFNKETGEVTNGDKFKVWTPIGNDSNNYTGTFDGQNHTVSGLYFNEKTDNVGLFGYIGCVKNDKNEIESAGKVSNVGVIDSYFKGNKYIGGVCGWNYGTIINCYNAGAVSGTGTNSKNIGGVCGWNYGTIINCYNSGAVSGNLQIGGVCGYTYYGSITNCYNEGTVSGTGTNSKNIGGVCGAKYGSSSKITNSYNSGTVSGIYSIGGVCGENYGGEISNSYNEGTVSGTSYSIGGVCGYNYNYGEISNSYNAGAVSGTVSSSWRIGGVCGWNDGTIINCYNSGTVSGTGDNIGGVCGDNYGEITNCYYDKDICKVGGINGTDADANGKAEGKTTQQFKDGEVAYLLWLGCKIGDKEYNGSIWGQQLGTDADAYPVLDAKKTVHRNETTVKCKNIVIYSYSNEAKDADNVEHKHSVGGVCEYCDHLANGKDGFKSASVTLTDGVILNYYVLLSDDALADADAYIKFEFSGKLKTIKLSEGVMVDSETGKYKFSLELRPDQMADEIISTVVYSDGANGSSVKYSVQKYADNQRGKVSAETEALIDAMLNYGATAQKYTKHNTDNLAKPSNTDAFSGNVTISDAFKMYLGDPIDGIKVRSASLIAGALTTIKVKYEVLDNYSIEDFEFTCDGKELTPVKEDGYYYIYIEKINPQDIDKMYEIVVTEIGTENTRTLRYSALTYARSIINNSTEESDLVDMMKALYYYNKAADAYIASQPTNV